MPRFTMEKDYDLLREFSDMGLTDVTGLDRMLDPDELTEAEEDETRRITAIVHESFIEVDEKGTEAAAATAVAANNTSAPVEQFALRFDRTFHYVIYDHPSASILFMGRVDDPR